MPLPGRATMSPGTAAQASLETESNSLYRLKRKVLEGNRELNFKINLATPGGCGPDLQHERGVLRASPGAAGAHTEKGRPRPRRSKGPMRNKEDGKDQKACKLFLTAQG